MRRKYAEKELDTLFWLIDIVQEEVNTPICIDSPNVNVLKEVLPSIKRSGIVNSVSGENNKCDVIFPLLQGNDWQVIALTCGDKGVPADAATKVEIAVRLVKEGCGIWNRSGTHIYRSSGSGGFCSQ